MASQDQDFFKKNRKLSRKIKNPSFLQKLSSEMFLSMRYWLDQKPNTRNTFHVSDLI